MSKKKKLTKINKTASRKTLEIKAILEALSNIEQESYPSNVLVEIAKKKLLNVFRNIEKNREILKIID
jgi:hypothetical protein